MATNRVYADGYHLSLTASDPTTPQSGDPVRIGALTGVALTDEAEGGNPTGKTSIDLSQSVWDLSVKGVNDSGNSAVAYGDALFYVDADTPKLSKKASGYFFGIALEAVNSGATTTINVLHVPTPGAGTLGAGTVNQAALADAILNGADVATVADVNVIGGIPLIFRILATTLTGDVDVVMTHKVRVINAWCVATAAGGAADTVIVKNGATAITDAMDLNVSDKVVVRAGTIDDAQHEIAAAGTLRISGASGVNAIVYVEAIRVA